MINRGWEHFGEDIRQTVQDAIDSQNYNKLNQTITNTINDAMRKVGKKSLKPWEKPDLYVKTTGAKVGAMMLSIGGYTMSIVMFLVMLVVLFATVFMVKLEVGVQVAMSILGGFFITGITLGVTGTRILGKVKRFRMYIKVLEGREYCDIKELAEHLKKSPRYVLKDIRKMIAKGWFRQGHLDETRTCLITSHETFNQYRALMNRREEAEKEIRQSKEAQEKMEEQIDPKVREVLQEGKAFIQKIRKSNDAIPGMEISGKISRIEMVIDRIFRRVEENPENIPDIRRMMEYYLPTTVKLLEAYEELDKQPVGGENILSSKQEIEKTLDTLNGAFEKLLDGLFQDTAWEVAADISVLKTMLAQEGLGEDDF